MGVLERLGTTAPAVGDVVVAAVCMYALVILLTRVAGPRSLAKMSSFHFAAKSRSAGVHAREQVQAVVLETAGGPQLLADQRPAEELVTGVPGAELLR